MVGALIALGFSSTAFAIQTVHVTIKVVNRAGSAVPTSEVTALQDVAGVEPYGDVPVTATAVSGKPGYFTASLVEGDTYTLVITPTGSSLLDGNDEYMGGGQDLAWTPRRLFEAPRGYFRHRNFRRGGRDHGGR